MRLRIISVHQSASSPSVNDLSSHSVRERDDPCYNRRPLSRDVEIQGWPNSYKGRIHGCCGTHVALFKK
jgi:hypothetical protein